MSWQSACEELVREVAPADIGTKPIYLLDGQAVEHFDSRLASCGSGWTSRVADLMLAEHLSRVGQWQGRGFAAVVYPSRCGDQQHLIGCVLHELGHHLTYGEPGATSEPVEDVSRELLSWLPDAPTTPPRATEPRWHQHDDRFIRASCHLAFRVSALIESVRPCHLRFSLPYLGTPFSENVFMASLANELESRSTEPIRDILVSEPPRSFTERWQQATRERSMGPW